MSVTLDHASAIGDRFAAILSAWLGASTMAAIRAENARRRAAGDAVSCAAHDFCDANVAMAEAFAAVAGREPDAGAATDVALWNAAYSSALARHLTDKAEG